MKKRDIFAIGMTIIVLIFVFWGFVDSHNRSSHFKNIVNLSEESMYKSVTYAKKFDVEPEGRLGDMFNCLKKFRRTSHITPSKDISGLSGQLILNVDDYQIYFSIHTGEVTRAKLTKFGKDGKRIYSSSSVAVNCDVKLLNKFD